MSSWMISFHFKDEVCVKAYADDERIYDSDKDPVSLETRL